METLAPLVFSEEDENDYIELRRKGKKESNHENEKRKAHSILPRLSFTNLPQVDFVNRCLVIL